MPVVVLVADGGADAGLGHLSRCSALAVALLRKGASIRTLGLGLDSPFERYGVSWEPTVKPRLASADAIVLDSYRATEQLRLEAASTAPVVTFADDDRVMTGAALHIRSGKALGRGQELTGLAYACLGPEYWSIPPRDIRRKVTRVLVTTGAGDRASIGPALAVRLKNALPAAAVALVRGPFASAHGIAGVETIEAPASLFDSIAHADIVVTAAGQTMLEVLATGTPCVALVTIENQRRQADELQRSGALTLATSVPAAATAAAAIAGDVSARRRYANAGRLVVDGKGAMRVAGAVLDVAARPVAADAGHPAAAESAPQ